MYAPELFIPVLTALTVGYLVALAAKLVCLFATSSGVKPNVACLLFIRVCIALETPLT